MSLLSRVCVAVLALMVLLQATVVRAQTLFSNFGPNDGFQTINAAGFGTQFGQIIAIPFVPSLTRVVDTVQIPLRSEPDVVSVRVEIRPSAGAIPADTVLSSGAVCDVSTLRIYTFAMSPATLVAGQTYWLVADTSGASTSAYWQPTTPLVTGPLAVRGGGVGPNWVVFGNNFQLAARVSASAELGVCCSPLNGVCRLLEPADCTAMGMSLIAGDVCSPGACPAACPPDFNRSGTITVQDIFDFLAAYFAGC